ncbi:MAG: sigma-70 family RNA polymerase sigma factor [Planctomycetota bacterium]|nr:sigma-70 family RNA polymerase sigma factor [Planctomycetota bacterium]
MTEFPQTRSSLIAQVQSPEDREAWDQFVLIYRPVIYRMARRRGMQDADAQDLSQDVLIRISKSIKGWVPQEGVRFRHWLRKVASNAIVTAQTKSKPLGIVNGSAAEQILAEAPEASAVTSELQDECFREQYLCAAAIVRVDVSPATWAAFEQTVIQGQSCEEAAESLGKSLGTIYAARSRILKRLQIEVQRLEGDTP